MQDEPALAKKQRNRRLLWGLAAVVLGIFFLGDLALPDCLPAVDEVVAGLLTVISAYNALKSRLPGKRQELPPAPPQP